LIEQGQRKSLEPLVARLGDEADYQSLQQFLADSPWDPAAVVRAVAERVAGAIEVEAWVLDDTGFVKDGKHSPGVKRQYSGTLGKVGNCQIGVSLHAVGATGTVPLGWALYLPQDWCEDAARRRRAKVPAELEFKTKPELGVELIERAARWDVPAAAVLGDCAYGDNTELRERLHRAGREYVLSVSAETTVFAPETTFAVTGRAGKRGRPRSRPRPDRGPEAIGELIARLGPRALAGRHVPRRSRWRAGRLALLLPARARREPLREAHAVATARGVADRRVARARRGAHRLLALQPPRRRPARAPRAPGPAALEDRARLQAAQGRARPRPLRGPLVARLAPPHRARHGGPRLPHARTAAPKSPAAGLTLPRAVLLLQPLFRCWAGRCQTCSQPVELDRLDLGAARQDE
jgi:hypothetical protein